MAKKKRNRTDEAVVAPNIRDEILDFACNQIEVYTTAPVDDTTPPAGWIARKLLTHGALAYVPDGILKGWYKADKYGMRDRYGRPEMIFASTDATARAALALNVGEGSDEARYIRANPAARPPIFTIDRYAALIQRIDTAITANVIASMRSQILGVPDDQREEVDYMLNAAAVGMPVVLDADLISRINTTDVSVPYVAGDLHALRQTIYAEALKHFGAVTPTEYKAERVQGAEVAAHVAEAIDSVYIMIDQFNADCEAGGVPYRMRYNGVGANYEGVQVDADPAETPQEVDNDE